MDRRTILKRVGAVSIGAAATSGVAAASNGRSEVTIDGESFLVSEDVDVDELGITAEEIRSGGDLGTTDIKSCCPPSECDYLCDICCY